MFWWRLVQKCSKNVISAVLAASPCRLAAWWTELAGLFASLLFCLHTSVIPSSSLTTITHNKNQTHNRQTQSPLLHVIPQTATDLCMSSSALSISSGLVSLISTVGLQAEYLSVQPLSTPATLCYRSAYIRPQDRYGVQTYYQRTHRSGPVSCALLSLPKSSMSTSSRHRHRAHLVDDKAGKRL